jgi:hypothetical protein
VTKATLEGLFVDELERLQPTAGYMRLVKELVLRAWQERKAQVGSEAADVERKAKAIQQKLDRLDEAYLYTETIDLTSYGSETGCARSSRSRRSTNTPSTSKSLTVEGVLAFTERVWPRAADLWVEASLNQKQRLQQLFFGEGVAFDGKQFVRTAVTANAFKYLTAAQSGENEVASPTPASWNRIARWIRQIDGLRGAA